MFKHTGDGAAAVFASAADAVNAELRDGDYFGTTLNRCARLMGVALGRQIVSSEATAALVSLSGGAGVPGRRR